MDGVLGKVVVFYWGCGGRVKGGWLASYGFSFFFFARVVVEGYRVAITSEINHENCFIFPISVFCVAAQSRNTIEPFSLLSQNKKTRCVPSLKDPHGFRSEKQSKIGNIASLSSFFFRFFRFFLKVEK